MKYLRTAVSSSGAMSSRHDGTSAVCHSCQIRVQDNKRDSRPWEVKLGPTLPQLA